MSQAAFAIPGDPATPTGGYVYDARLIEAAGGALTPLPLPAGFPNPTAAELAASAAALSAAPGLVLIDGLAYGALPADLIDALPRRPVALCHHPLGHEPGLTEAEARRLIETERAALARAAHVVVTSAATKAALIAEFAMAAGDVTVAEPGLDPAPPVPAHHGGEGTGGRGAPVILTVASLTPRKGHDVLIGALARIADRPWTCDFAGPDDRDAPWAARLRRMTAEGGLEGRIRFLGARNPAGLEALYARADVFCLPSRYEGYGMVVAEAMMRALPVVATTVGAAPEILTGVAGRLVPPDDETALAAALAAYLDDPGARRAAGAAGRRAALAMPGWAETWAAVEGALAKAAP